MQGTSSISNLKRPCKNSTPIRTNTAIHLSLRLGKKIASRLLRRESVTSGARGRMGKPMRQASGLKLEGLERAFVAGPVKAWLLRKVEAPILLRGVQLPANARVLEIGAGKGTGTLALLDHFPSARVITLAENFRSTKAILQDADSLIGTLNLTVSAVLSNGKRCPNEALPGSRYCGLPVARTA